jgi:oxygen-dependent protoporphyrinogen oxidase
VPIPRVLVIGGGISGLSTAHFLLRRLEEDGLEAEVALVEAAPRVGGVLGSDSVEGFVFERGPNGFLDNSPDTLDLVRDLELEASLRRAEATARDRFLLKDGKLHALPRGPLSFLRSPLLSVRGRLRALSEPFRAKGPPGEDESVATFGRRRLGREVVRTLLDPLVTGVYAGDVERLSIRSAFPRLYAMEREHGSLLGGLRAARRAQGHDRRSGPRRGSLLGATLSSFDRGLETLSSALRRRLGARVRTEAPVESVRPGDGRFTVRLRDGRLEDAASVVVATPAGRAAGLLGARRPELARALEAIPYAPVAVVCLGYRRGDVAHPLEGYGFLIPRDQGLRTLGVIWTSSLFPEHAPAGCVSLRALVGGARDPDAVDLSVEELVDLVRRDVGPILGIAGAPLVSKVFRHATGIPQYTIGHGRRLERIEDERRAVPGLFLAGNAYRGIAVNDCIREARRVSAEVVDLLRQNAA